MRAVVLPQPRTPTVQDGPRSSPGPGEVVVDVQVAGVCGTDVHLDEGGFFARFPLTPGHEFTGRVREVGAGVEHVAVGQRVAVDNASACGSCVECSRGNHLFCRDFRSLGVNAPGGFAESVLTPAHKVYDAEDLAPDVAVLAEPLACVVHGLDVLALRPGADVLVLGAGTTGLLLAQLLAHGGAGRVTVAAPTEFKLDLARAFGADRVVQIPRDPDAAAAGGVRRGRGRDGRRRTCRAPARPRRRPWDRVRLRDVRRGRHCAVTALRHLPARADRQGSFAQVDCMDRALRLLRSGRVRTDGLVTHRFPLERYAEALDTLRHDPTSLKVVIDVAG